jgi:hypothetical protein
MMLQGSGTVIFLLRLSALDYSDGLRPALGLMQHGRLMQVPVAHMVEIPRFVNPNGFFRANELVFLTHVQF